MTGLAAAKIIGVAPRTMRRWRERLEEHGYAAGLMGQWHLGSTPDTVPNAHGCGDFYSHRFYWGEPRVPNHHDRWRNRTEICEDGQ